MLSERVWTSTHGQVWADTHKYDGLLLLMHSSPLVMIALVCAGTLNCKAHMTSSTGRQTDAVKGCLETYKMQMRPASHPPPCPSLRLLVQRLTGTLAIPISSCIYKTRVTCGQLTSSAAYFSTAVKGASSGTLNLCIATEELLLVYMQAQQRAFPGRDGLILKNSSWIAPQLCGLQSCRQLTECTGVLCRGQTLTL